MIKKYIKNPFMWSTGVSVCALTSAFVLQYGFQVFPCDLCLWQRGVYAVLLMVSLAAFMRLFSSVWLAILGAVVSLIGMSFAVYHVGIEQHWWTKLGIADHFWPFACSSLPEAQDFQAFKEQLLQQAVLCNEVTWSLFGISLAGYNILVFGIVFTLFIGHCISIHLVHSLSSTIKELRL